MSVRLYAMMPFSLDRNLGAAYNDAMALIPEDGWACFLDHDMMLTTRDWYRQLVEAIEFKPEAGLFTAVTNRIGAKWQRADEASRGNHDIRYHRDIGNKRLVEKRSLLDVTDTKGFGGVLMCLSKQAWRDAGGFADGLLCVDHSIHFGLQRAGRRIYLLESLYVYHWRRAFGDDLPDDTPRAENCPCRGFEKLPTVHIPLPKRTSLNNGAVQ